MKLGDFKEILEKRLDKKQIAEIREMAQVEANKLRQQQKKKPNPASQK